MLYGKWMPSKKKPVELRRVYQPTLPTTWDTFIWEFIADHRTHPPLTYFGIITIKLGLSNINSE